MNRASSFRACALCFAVYAACASAATPITVVNNAPLSFGKFVAGTGGSVSISPNGARSSAGGVALIASGVGSAARFTVSGDLVTYSIVLPANGTVSLTAPSGQLMPVSNFTSSPSGSGMMSGAGNQIVTVGATLTVGSQQAPASYTGTFDIRVDYN
jgi:hypothetical protein